MDAYLRSSGARYYVYHCETGPVRFFDSKKAAEDYAADLNANISDDRTGYHVVDGSRSKYMRVW